MNKQIFRATEEQLNGDPYEELMVSVLLQAIKDYRANYRKAGLRREDILIEMKDNWMWEHFLPKLSFESAMKNA